MSIGKIIIVTYGFPPYLKSLGGSIRILKLADYLISQGLDVTVVCARTPHFDTFGYDDTLARIKTIACDDPIANLARRAAGATKAAASTGPTPADSPVSRVKRRLKDMALEIMVPDIGLPVTRRMYRAVQREIESSAGPATVITSGPPHSAHLVGKRVKRWRKDVAWIMDYRDSWNGTSLFRKRNDLLQWWNAVVERACLREADHISYISGPMLPKAEAIAAMPLVHKATLIANGYDDALLPAASRPVRDAADGAALRIGYYGAVDHGSTSYRDPAIIFRALLALPEDAVQFVVHGPSTLEAGWQERLGTRLKNGGKLPHDKAVNSMFGMDALLLLHTREEGADEVVTGKVFEYISTGRPIISVGPASMAVNQLLQSDPLFHWIDHRDEAGLTALFRSLSQRTESQRNERRPDTLIRSFSRTAQHEKFLRLLTAPR